MAVAVFFLFRQLLTRGGTSAVRMYAGYRRFRSEMRCEKQLLRVQPNLADLAVVWLWAALAASAAPVALKYAG